MLAVALLAWPVMTHFPVKRPRVWLPIAVAALVIVVLAPNAIYLASQSSLHRNWLWRLRWLPVLTGLGVGLTVNNTHAVLEALFGKTGEFVRTPKQGDRKKRRYGSRKSIVPWIELALGLYCVVSLASYLSTGRPVIGIFLAVYSASFFSVGILSLREQRGPKGPATLAGAKPLANEAPT